MKPVETFTRTIFTQACIIRTQARQYYLKIRSAALILQKMALETLE